MLMLELTGDQAVFSQLDNWRAAQKASLSLLRTPLPSPFASERSSPASADELPAAQCPVSTKASGGIQGQSCTGHQTEQDSRKLGQWRRSRTHYSKQVLHLYMKLELKRERRECVSNSQLKVKKNTSKIHSSH